MLLAMHRQPVSQPARQPDRADSDILTAHEAKLTFHQPTVQIQAVCEGEVGL